MCYVKTGEFLFSLLRRVNGSGTDRIGDAQYPKGSQTWSAGGTMEKIYILIVSAMRI